MLRTVALVLTLAAAALPARSQEVYTVVVGSYQTPGFAQAQLRVWGQKGLGLMLIRAEARGRTVYRLAHGTYTALVAADSSLRSLQARYGLQGWIWRTEVSAPTVQPTPEGTGPARDPLPPPRRDTLVVLRRDTVYAVYLPGSGQTDTLEYLAPSGEVLQKIAVPHQNGRFPSVSAPENEGMLLAVIDSLDHRLRVSVDLYVDAYYAGQNHPALPDGTRELATPGLRNEQIGLNTAQITARVNGTRFRGLVTLQAGGIRQQAWDPVTELGIIQQAYAGVRLTKGLWLDAGLFMTHIGGEAIFPRDNWISSLALVTYYEPFIQAGARLSWDITPRLQLQLHALNGYNTVEDNNRSLSGGWLITWLAQDWLTLYSSGIVGNERPADSAYALRAYSNTVAVVTPLKWLSLKAQVDYGTEAAAGAKPLQTVLAGQAQARVQFLPRWSVATRAEYYRDRDAMLSPAVVGWGATAQLEFKPSTTSFLRAEARWLNMDEPFFLQEPPATTLSRARLDWMLGLGVWL